MNIDITDLTNSEKAALVCLYYAHLNDEEPEYKDCEKNLRAIAKKTNCKYRALENDKNTFKVYLNERNGWKERLLEKGSKFLSDISDKYSIYTIDELESAATAIMEEMMKEEKPFFSIKTKDPETVKAVLARQSSVVFDGINILQDSLKLGQPVFIVFGGDRPSWVPGLAGMGVISRKPYDIGYEGRNFKIQVDVKLLLNKHISREDLLPYRDTYGIIGIGPITKWEPNQAISQVSENKAIALMRAMLEIDSRIENDLKNIVNDSVIQRVKGATTKYVAIEVDYGESYADAIKEYFNNDNQATEDPAPDEEDVAGEYTATDFLSEIFITEDEYETLRELLLRKKNIILQGAPGVGKTFAAKRLAYSILGGKYKNRVETVQFHQSYTYEDFIMGFRPTANGFALIEGPFYKFCMKARSDKRPHFFIIDEINRGNLSKIFGELLMLIEADKREKEAVNILYKNEAFSVPENLYIIGMMNTADRGLAMIDYALRRRFAFFCMKPAFDSEKFLKMISDSSNKAYDLIDTVKSVNKDIVNDDALGEGFEIGHSYFCLGRPLTDKDVTMIAEYEIIPLIKEYWFDEPDKINHCIDKLREVLK